MLDDLSGVGAAPFPAHLSERVTLTPPSFVVAIPVRDEEERLPACLRALAQQRDRLGRSIPPTLVRIVVFANNCTDQSASVARALAECWSLDIQVVETWLPPEAAHAGAARRAAMDLAEAWLMESGEDGGVILTTDADSQVTPNWIATNLAAFEAGAIRFSDASSSTTTASSCPTRFIGAARSRTRMSGCSPNCRGCSIPLSTIRGLITPRSPAPPSE